MARTLGAARMPGVSAVLGHARDERRHARIGLEPAGDLGATGKRHHVVVALRGLVEGGIGEQACRYFRT